MKHLLAVYFFFCLLFTTVLAQSNERMHHKQLYEDAFKEMQQMLEGKQAASFKRSVFLMENAFLNDQKSYLEFNGQIQKIIPMLQQMIREKNLGKYKTAGNWAVFSFMKDTIRQNGFKPYTYDFDNFMPDKDPTVGFVTKLLSTKKGNCVSLPYLYKILCEEIGASANLALAPLHCYIKHKDESGRWANLELTNGSFSRDEWIMQECGVTVEQIQTGIYMRALSQKESIVVVLQDLANNYRFQFGNDSFILEACETGLNYFPNSVGLLVTKFECYRLVLLDARKRKDKVLEHKANKILSEIDKELNSLSYKPPSAEDYVQWAKENEKGKQDANKKRNK